LSGSFFGSFLDKQKRKEEASSSNSFSQREGAALQHKTNILSSTSALPLHQKKVIIQNLKTFATV